MRQYIIQESSVLWEELGNVIFESAKHLGRKDLQTNLLITGRQLQRRKEHFSLLLRIISDNQGRLEDKLERA